MILSAVDGRWPDFAIILVLLAGQRPGRVLGGTPGRQRHRGAEGQAGDDCPGSARRDVGHSAARELVPGDVIRLRLGGIVPADAQLLPGEAVQVDQSALTGESLPATREPGEAVFSGSIIRRERPTPWSTPPAPTPTSVRRRSWSRRPTRSATSSEPC